MSKEPLDRAHRQVIVLVPLNVSRTDGQTVHSAVTTAAPGKESGETAADSMF